MGVKVVDGTASTPALEFAYGFKVRPFFPKLIETAAQRVAWLNSQRLDRQFVATWPDIYGYGLPRAQCSAWHGVLNDTLASWCDENAARMLFVASVPLPNANDAAAELERAAGLGAVAAMVSANIEGKNIGELPLDPLWARAEQLHMPMMIYPMASTPFPRAAKFGLTQSVQYTFDTNSRGRFFGLFRCARSFPGGDPCAIARRRRLSLSRGALRHHAREDGQSGTG